MPTNTLTKPTSENLYTDAPVTKKPHDEIDAVVTWQPQGGLVIDARFAGGNGGQDVAEVAIDQHGNVEATIDGQQLSDIQTAMLGDALGVNLPNKVDPNDIELLPGSPLQAAFNQARDEQA